MKRWIGIVLLAVALPAFGQGYAGKGEGAIVLKDDAPVYGTKKGKEPAFHLKLGDAVAGMTVDQTTLWMGDSTKATAYQFTEKDGRVQVLYFAAAKLPAMPKGGWMDLADLATFIYDGSCGERGAPTTYGMKRQWNVCFKEARDAKLEELRAQWEAEAAAAAEAPHPTP